MTTHVAVDTRANGAASLGDPLPAVAADRIRYQVGFADDAPEDLDAPVFFLTEPTGELVAAAASALARAGMNPVTSADYRHAVILALDEAIKAVRALPAGSVDAEGMLADGSRVILTEQEFDDNRAIVEAVADLEPWDTKKQGRVPWERRVLSASYNRLVDWTAEHSPYYTQLRQREAENEERKNAIVCRFALRGWERRSGVCEVVGLEATAASVATLTVLEQAAIAARWERAQRVSGAAKKSSSLPSPSTPSRMSSEDLGGRATDRPTS